MLFIHRLESCTLSAGSLEIGCALTQGRFKNEDVQYGFV